ncbi:M15 family metallopeptidase [Amnibacterium kyonggiense]|uniref:D-alanyl-D-alanine dipeptidase n=1 Tax=Amnibacterium kyonggiense TaxID=595671 RepID=A0A4R7FSB5_9MICO|nr:M15 family metallopeptidase [Amnibacterium kyonggiense]TDS80559.1 D-alanyl-D-alanine dipeptidase [Amnibacterium kyonggiense]
MPVLLADPPIAAVPVADAGEPLVPVPADTAALDGPRPLVRSGVAARLAVAQLLLPPGRRLRVVEGHRRPEDQLAIWRRYAADVARDHPLADAAEQRRLTSRFVSPLEVAPHVAGAAVDVVLVDRLGREVDLGTPVDATPEQSGGACFTDAVVPRAAQEERRLLIAAMTGAGFVNYPTEWWHWSHGDRYWAWSLHAPAALYGPVDVPALVAR